MNSPAPLKKNWVLTQEAFDRLLACLDVDREQAALKYERLRLKMIKYFEWRGAAFPDREADETINRVARKIEAGAQIQNINAYAYGVACMVFAESLRARAREKEVFEQTPVVEMEPSEEETSEAERRACLDRCLQHLPGESRELIIDYYQEERGKKIEHRKRLAARLGLTLNALRISAHRVRLNLEACVRKCLGQHA